jgi:hypothetical protein
VFYLDTESLTQPNFRLEPIMNNYDRPVYWTNYKDQTKKVMGEQRK